MASLIDLSSIPLPAAVDVPDYEFLRRAWLERYAELHGVAVSDLNDNDPAVRVCEVGAYREMLRMASVNDAVRDTMLASARGRGLDDLGADPLYGGLKRLVIDPGNPLASPPLPPVMERDESYKARLVLSPAALSVAGPAGAYEVLAKSAHPDVLDVAVSSPAPCDVLVEVLHTSTDPAIIAKIADALSHRSVRPIGDRVTVQDATKQASMIALTLYVPDGPDLVAVQTASVARLNDIAIPACRRVRSGEKLSEGAPDAWLGACVVPGVRSWSVAARTGASNTAAAWWPMTITVIAVRSNAS